jgi:molybdopterin-guanine dinucleotide biosynthesis protein A
MDALILAGGIIAEDDPLFPYTVAGSKSLIEIAGKPLTQWVVDALTGSKHTKSIYIVGLEPSSGITSKKPLSFLPDQGDVFSNVRRGFHEIMRSNPSASHALLTSSDIPAINPQIVDWRIEIANSLDKDVHYAVIERDTMQTRFPGANRTYLRLRDGRYCGADMNVVKLAAFLDEKLWRRLSESRKSPLKQAALIGLDTLFLVLISALTLEKAERIVAKRLRLEAEVIIAPYAELGMDIDNPQQLVQLRNELEHWEA